MLREQKQKFENIKNDKNLNITQIQVLEGCSRKVVYPMLEKELIDLSETMDIRGMKFSYNWTKRFKQRNKLVKRARTQVAQKVPEDILTSIWFDMPRDSTIDFKDTHKVYNRDDVTRALKAEGLDMLEIPRGTTSVLQPLDISVNKPFKNRMRNKWEEWMDKGEKKYTKKGNLKKASYKLVYELVSETWREISSNLLIKSFEASGLVLNPDGSEDDMISGRLKAIVENCLNELPIEDTQAEESNHDDSEPNDGELDDDEMDNGETNNSEMDNGEIDNEQNDNNLDYYDLDYYKENIMDIEYYGEMYSNEATEIN
ncbi:2440_t:CDS:2 [Dentiscutata erythropus]|uniref:2440_t:CDS:1 n=1 Tax=Dentiscutata erythropus TaxID=1348616 RepID=A0A9N9HWG5_9GLOM|nr:2440_t:CDS:2 [Dentiscutata erythropus]